MKKTYYDVLYYHGECPSTYFDDCKDVNDVINIARGDYEPDERGHFETKEAAMKKCLEIGCNIYLANGRRYNDHWEIYIPVCEETSYEVDENGFEERIEEIDYDWPFIFAIVPSKSKTYCRYKIDCYNNRAEQIKALSGDMSLKDFCEKYSIPYSTYMKWLSGERECPDYVLSLLSRVVKEDYYNGDFNMNFSLDDLFSVIDVNDIDTVIEDVCYTDALSAFEERSQEFPEHEILLVMDDYLEPLEGEGITVLDSLDKK